MARRCLQLLTWVYVCIDMEAYCVSITGREDSELGGDGQGSVLAGGMTTVGRGNEGTDG